MIKNKKIYYINSANLLSGSISNFSYYLDIKSEDNFNRCTVLQVNFPKSYFSVSDNYNNFKISENGTIFNITLQNGNYNRISFGYSITNLLNTLSPNHYTYNVYYSNFSLSVPNNYNSNQNPDTGLFCFTCNSTNQIIYTLKIYGKVLVLILIVLIILIYKVELINYIVKIV